MKFMKKSIFLLPCVACAVVGVLLLASCSKDGAKGDTGPAGPAGPTGAAGAAGVQGAAGTANVIYSAWIDVIFDPVVDSTVTPLDTIAWTAEIPAAKLDNAILTNGEVKVYMNVSTSDNPAVFPLPITDLFALTGVQNVNLYFIPGAIELYSTEDASTFTTTGGKKAWQFRYVLIPGGTAARSSKIIDWNNYAAVKAYLGLKD
jgi:hypothetical protein